VGFDSHVDVSPLVLDVVEHVQELVVTLVEDTLRVDVFHLFNEELDVLDLLNDGLSLRFSGELDVFFGEAIPAAAEEASDIQVLLVLADHGFQG